MGLPASVRVKLSSEEAGYLSITPVVVREMPLEELLEMILGATGKDLERIGEILGRGTLVSGASRLRWEGFRAGREDLRAALGAFPDPEPARRFAPRDCVCAVLKGTGCRIEIPRRAGMARGLLRRRSFWDALMEVAGRRRTRYAAYCYRQRADCYTTELTPEEALELQTRADALSYSSLARQVRQAHLEGIEFYVVRR